MGRDRLKEALLVFDGCSDEFFKTVPYPSERGPLRFGTQSAEPLVFRIDFFDRTDIWFEYRKQLGHTSITKMAEMPMPLVSRHLHSGKVQAHFEVADRELILLEAVARIVGEEAMARAERGEVRA